MMHSLRYYVIWLVIEVIVGLLQVVAIVAGVGDWWNGFILGAIAFSTIDNVTQVVKWRAIYRYVSGNRRA